MPSSINTLHSLSNRKYSIPRESNTTAKCIPTLSSDDIAQNLLHRLYTEFSPIAKARKYTITTLTEMCCCDDGIHHITQRRGRRGGKRRKSMPNNVLGYNISYRKGVSEIHIRLRHPQSHGFLEYDDIASTMAHELAHCQIGSHSAEFYELMGEIEMQREQFLRGGVVLDKDGFPMGSNGEKARRLGGGDNSIGESGIGARDKRANAANQRAQRSKIMGGGPRVLGKRSGARLNPRDAARIAAERRLADSKWCLPCNEIIEILDDDEIIPIGTEENGTIIIDGSDDSDSECEIIEIKKPSKTQTTKSNETNNTTHSKSRTRKRTIDSNNSTLSLPGQHTRSKKPKSVWSCKICTCENPSLVLSCIACGTALISDNDNRKHAMAIARREEVQHIKNREVEQSKKDFGGFNIYGSGS